MRHADECKLPHINHHRLPNTTEIAAVLWLFYVEKHSRNNRTGNIQLMVTSVSHHTTAGYYPYKDRVRVKLTIFTSYF